MEISDRALTNIASGDREFTQKLVDLHCMEAFFDLLKNTTDEETADQAIWGLGNIVGDSPTLRDKALEGIKNKKKLKTKKTKKNGILEYIIEHLDNFPSLVKRNAVWTLSNFCRGKPSPNWKKVSKMLKPLANLIERMEDYDAMADVLWSFSFLSEDREEGDTPKAIDNDFPSGFNIDGVIQTGIVKHVINVIKFASKMGEDAWNTISQ
ncbi:importin alpha, partial [Reticulomyxa filosa]